MPPTVPPFDCDSHVLNTGHRYSALGPAKLENGWSMYNHHVGTNQVSTCSCCVVWWKLFYPCKSEHVSPELQFPHTKNCMIFQFGGGGRKAMLLAGLCSLLGHGRRLQNTHVTSLCLLLRVAFWLREAHHFNRFLSLRRTPIFSWVVCSVMETSFPLTSLKECQA